MHDGDKGIPLQANWLKSAGIQKGDAVAIYMPMICELPSEALLLFLARSTHISKPYGVLLMICNT